MLISVYIVCTHHKKFRFHDQLSYAKKRYPIQPLFRSLKNYLCPAQGHVVHKILRILLFPLAYFVIMEKSEVYQYYQNSILFLFILGRFEDQLEKSL